MITKENTSWYLDKFSLLVPYEMYGEQFGELERHSTWHGFKRQKSKLIRS